MDVQRTLRQANSALELPIVMITANDRTDEGVEALKEGANDYVTKPVDLNLALARIDKQLVLKKSHHDLNYQKLLLNCQIEVSPDGILAISNLGDWLSSSTGVFRGVGSYGASFFRASGAERF